MGFVRSIPPPAAVQKTNVCREWEAHDAIAVTILPVLFPSLVREIRCEP
jgi:hypothetical protein